MEGRRRLWGPSDGGASPVLLVLGWREVLLRRRRTPAFPRPRRGSFSFALPIRAGSSYVFPPGVRTHLQVGSVRTASRCALGLEYLGGASGSRRACRGQSQLCCGGRQTLSASSKSLSSPPSPAEHRLGQSLGHVMLWHSQGSSPQSPAFWQRCFQRGTDEGSLLVRGVGRSPRGLGPQPGLRLTYVTSGQFLNSFKPQFTHR